MAGRPADETCSLVAVLGNVPTAIQPTFGDSDEELGADPTASGRAPPSAATHSGATLPMPRLVFASAKTAKSTIQRQVDENRDVKVFVMNESLVDCYANAECVEMDSGKPFDVEETPRWHPTRDELVGVAMAAWEVARYLAEDTDNAVVIVSRHGKDAPRFLAGCAAGAVKRLFGATDARAAVGRATVRPADVDLRRIAEKFKNWSEVVARGAIQSNCV